MIQPCKPPPHPPKGMVPLAPCGWGWVLPPGRARGRRPGSYISAAGFANV